MTDRKISELVAVTSVDDADEFVLARSGSSNKISGSDLKAAGGSLPVAAGTPSPSVGDVVGVIYNVAGIYVVGGVDKDTPLNGNGAVLSDAYAQWNGNGDGLVWSGNGTDGQQSLRLRTGSHETILGDGNGTLTAGAGGVIFPSSDPHVAGAWWDNMGVLTRSSG